MHSSRPAAGPAGTSCEGKGTCCEEWQARVEREAEVQVACCPHCRAHRETNTHLDSSSCMETTLGSGAR